MESVQPRKNDKYIPYYFVVVFMVIFAVNGYMVYEAISTHTGVVESNTYKKGLAYNDVIAAKNAQDKLGWSSSLNFDGQIITVSLLDANSNVIKGADIDVYFSRPTQAGYDFKAKLISDANGKYSSKIDFPFNGLWDARLSAVWKQQKYQKHQRIVVK